MVSHSVKGPAAKGQAAKGLSAKEAKAEAKAANATPCPMCARSRTMLGGQRCRHRAVAAT